MGESRRRRWVIAELCSALVLGALAWALFVTGRPRSDRDWAPDHKIEARVTFEAESVRVDSVRDFRHSRGGAFEAAYRSERFDLADVRRVWFALAPFTGAWSGLAHTFVSFELAGGRFLAVSVEARRERGEAYSLWGGLTRRFEVTYVVGTESDLLGVRALRGDILYLYPSEASPDQAREMLADMLRRAQALQAEPEFYNTVTNNSATNLREHVNRVAPEPLPFGWGILFPGYSDELALERGLLATDLSLEAARVRYRVDERAKAVLAEGAPDFSVRIRGGS